VRFLNEAAEFKKIGCKLYRIDRDIVSQSKNQKTDHVSENELNNYEGWDGVIDNNGSLNEFYARLDKLVFNLDNK
jgi:hypothetical protein